jgi:hypothetical protein
MDFTGDIFVYGVGQMMTLPELADLASESDDYLLVLREQLASRLREAREEARDHPILWHYLVMFKLITPEELDRITNEAIRKEDIRTLTVLLTRVYKPSQVQSIIDRLSLPLASQLAQATPSLNSYLRNRLVNNLPQALQEVWNYLPLLADLYRFGLIGHSELNAYLVEAAKYHRLDMITFLFRNALITTQDLDIIPSSISLSLVELVNYDFNLYAPLIGVSSLSLLVSADSFTDILSAGEKLAANGYPIPAELLQRLVDEFAGTVLFHMPNPFDLVNAENNNPLIPIIARPDLVDNPQTDLERKTEETIRSSSILRLRWTRLEKLLRYAGN